MAHELLFAEAMDQLTISADAGMRSRIQSLDLLANNLSNAGPPGYKADREFYDLYQTAEANESPIPGLEPDIERNWIDFGNGRRFRANVLSKGVVALEARE
jgi:flagellar basal body rod protein FlgG